MKGQENRNPDGISRRQFIGTSAAALAWTAFPKTPVSNKPLAKVGITLASYFVRWHSKAGSAMYPAFNSSLDLFEHCHQLGAGGGQISVSGWTPEMAATIRKKAESWGMFVEGQVGLPHSDGELPQFESDIKNAREAGVSIFRTACLSGRRYENFETGAAFDDFRKDAIAALQRAEPVMNKYKAKLAIENHKDWRVSDLLEILKRMDSEWIGVTLDTGNNISLLEDPMYVVESLAPHAFTTHFKDMGVEAYEDGFLLSEVPFGQGFLDLKAIIDICRKHNPEITFNLEMMTRDPLKVPYLTDKYWATFDGLGAPELAHCIRLVRDNASKAPLQRVSHVTPEQHLAFEEENNVACLVYAREHLGL